MLVNQTYKIDQLQLNSLLKRLLIRQIKLFGICLIVSILLQLLLRWNTVTILPLMYLTLGIIILVLITLIWGYKKTRKTFTSYELLLGQKEIEVKALPVINKKIKWKNLIRDCKKNGDIYLYDQNFSWMARKWIGEGTIIVPREINERESLLNNLELRLREPK
jgi:hypothetical protein